jgi:predicted Zn finger-like uncharacterized protein
MGAGEHGFPAAEPGALTGKKKEKNSNTGPCDLSIVQLSMRIHCPICSMTIEAAEAHIGDEGQCASCGAGFIVPAHSNDRIEIIAPDKLQLMEVDCPVCSTMVRVSDENIGKKGRCERCDSKFIVPENTGDKIEILERGRLPMLKIDCPVCSTVVRVTEVNIGKKGRCERCSSKFIVPLHPGEEAEILERGKLPMSKIDCPVCSTVVRVSWDNIGEKGRCEECSSKFMVPENPGGEIVILERGEVATGETLGEGVQEHQSEPVE